MFFAIGTRLTELPWSGSWSIAQQQEVRAHLIILQVMACPGYI